MEIDDLLLEKMKLVSNLAQHEDNLTWKKFSYFVSINGILLSVLAGIISAQNYFLDKINIWIIIFIISLYGAVVSLIWFITQKRGGAYHSYRLNQARILEETLDIGLDNREDTHSIKSYPINIFEKNIDEQYLVDRPKNTISVHSAVDIFCLFIFFVWTSLFFSSIFFCVFDVLKNSFSMLDIMRNIFYIIVIMYIIFCTLILTGVIYYLFGLRKKELD